MYAHSNVLAIWKHSPTLEATPLVHGNYHSYGLVTTVAMKYGIPQ